MTQELDNFRSAAYTAVEAAKSTFTDFTVLVEYENRRIINYDTVKDPIIDVEIKFMDSSQRDLHITRTQRVIGFLILTVKIKEGAGTSTALRLLEHMYRPLHNRKLGTANMEVAKLVPGKTVKGWWCQSIMVPFWLDMTA